MSSSPKSERDTIAGLGLLASCYVHFDPELKSGASVSHAYGFNVHCLIIDNADGDVLALERNRIHADDDPLQHAEQVAIRTAMEKLHLKRPRPVGMPVEKYYKSLLFMSPGTESEHFVDYGCTLYNTFDPCGMCAVTLLVCYMKRIAYLFEDNKFATVYEDMRKYFRNRDSVKDQLGLVDTSDGTLLADAAHLMIRLQEKVRKLEDDGVPLVRTLDHCREDLKQATEILIAVDRTSLKSEGKEQERNLRMLQGIKEQCNLN